MAEKEKTVSRENTIVKTGIIGIVANVLLASFKALVGVAVHSTAMVLDAVNNFSDVLSSVVTIIGTKIASKKPDKKHPLGHGRVEYLSQMIIAALIIYAGITALWESIKKIIEPVAAEHSAVSLAVISVAIVVKIFLGLYVRKKGKSVRSDLLISSGTDALFDAILSTAVLISAIILMLTGINIEAFVSVVISFFIFKAGVEIIVEAIDDMLGHRVEGEYTRKVKECVLTFPEVHGAYDIVLHNYGPDKYLGSLHIEVDDTMTADRIDTLTRNISAKVYENTGIILTAVGIYSRNSSDEKLMKMREQITELVVDHRHILQLHGFYVDEEKKRITFDVVVDFDEEDREGLIAHIIGDVKEALPEYDVVVAIDSDISDQ
ncbi:cation diffusion facilitator family transporter [Butyrivibrio sp. AE2032]|uniref:cation diffusion facilitator family transporter n=1 Tax=Butyrivibrio sp. AE2032 TaxID=1458463 RepID=UPI00054EE71D|nr:cation diffusion facilitator family transporter [Butyrivibrio sp. AE2032]